MLDSIEKARADCDRPVRHRLEHIETIPDEVVGRFASLGVAASMQPTHCCDYTRADHTRAVRAAGPGRGTGGQAETCPSRRTASIRR